MKIKRVRVSNFKSIRDVSFEIDRVNIIVGENSSGKSSILQALHLAFRCVANNKIQNNQSRTISVSDLDYFPTIEMRRIGSDADLRERRGETPEVFVNVELEFVRDEREPELVQIPIRRGRNEAIQVDLKSRSIPTAIYRTLGNREKPFSSYIPGLAGISSSEEKRSRLPVVRQAASGDANVVLRNVIHLIHEAGNIDDLMALVSSVLGETKIKPRFDEYNDFNLEVDIRTANMPDGRWSPLELAGTGVLQVIQIFAYIVLFRPRILLIDEPDSHLHADRQVKLMNALEEVAKNYDSQIILTTHSPNMVRACSDEARILWVNNGNIEGDPETVRQRMSWGLLDKSTLIISEDKDTSLLQEILDQWPQLSRRVAIWSICGVNSLPGPDAVTALKEITGVRSVILHRDADFMHPKERVYFEEKYNIDGCRLWITDGSDIEAYYCQRDVIAAQIGGELEWVEGMIEESIAENRVEFEKEFTNKRRQFNMNEKIYPGRAGTPTDDEVRRALGFDRMKIYKGKALHKKLKAKVQDLGRNGRVLEKLPEGIEVAADLRDILDAAL